MAQHLGVGGKALGAAIDKLGVEGPPAQQQMANAVEQGNVGAGANGQVQVGGLGGIGAARIDHDQLHVIVALVVLAQPVKHNRVAFGGVGADQKGAVGGLQIGVAAGGAIAAKAVDVPRHRRGHTEPRVGVKVVGAQAALHQLLGHVVVFGLKLPRAVDAEAVGPQGFPHGLNPLHDRIQRHIPTHPLKGSRQGLPPHRVLEPIAIEGLSHRGPLHTHHALARGVGAIAPSLPQGCTRRIPVDRFVGLGWGQDFQATPHAAIGAQGLSRISHRRHEVIETSDCPYRGSNPSPPSHP